MTPPVTVCIPCAPYHEQIVQRAIDSVEAQTVPTNTLWSLDEKEQGPGVVRNRLLNHVETPYVVFLDADDWIAPTFVEECLRVIRPGRYVYTDWYNPENYREAPEFPWCKRAYMKRTWHVITCLLHTQDVRNVSGFDETLPTQEDTDFWLKLTERGVCGIHIRKGLMYYGEGGKRGELAVQMNAETNLMAQILERYPNPMPCCGRQVEIDKSVPIGERQPNDVLATPRWRGNRQEYGRITRRWYPRGSQGDRMWVDRRDIEAQPRHWEELVEPAVEQHGNGMNAFVQVFHDPKGTPEKQYTAPAQVPGDFTPDIDTIMRIAEERLG